MENDCLAGTWFLTGARKIFQSLMVVMAAQHQECTKSHWAARGILLQCKKKKKEAALSILILEALQGPLFSEESKAWDCE